MTFSIKRLGPGDDATLQLLARQDADFDLDGRGEALEPLTAVMARAYLANPAVLLWVAAEDDVVVGFLGDTKPKRCGGRSRAHALALRPQVIRASRVVKTALTIC